MKRKKERYLNEFSKLLKVVERADYFFDGPNKTTINLWWLGNSPIISLKEVGGIYERNTEMHRLPLPILIVLVTELKEREKIKI